MFTKKNVRAAQKKCEKNYSQFVGFEILRLRDFLHEFSEEHRYDFITEKKNILSPYDIILLVDRRPNTTDTMSYDRRKTCQKSCRTKRNKIKSRYHYSNIFNRIHGFLIVENLKKNKNIPKGKKVFSLSLICSSSYSDKRGVGSLLMDAMIELGKISKFTDIILEVSNEYSAREESDEESSEESDEESSEESDEESSEESADESVEESSEESDDEEDLRELFNEPLVNRISLEFLRKTFRLRTRDGNTYPYYNISEDYIYDIIYSYINDYYDEEDYHEYTFDEFDPDEPDEYDYGGYYYSKGKKSQIDLFKFYEKFGFVEDGRIHYEWKAFTTDPFPCLIKSL